MLVPIGLNTYRLTLKFPLEDNLSPFRFHAIIIQRFCWLAFCNTAVQFHSLFCHLFCSSGGRYGFGDRVVDGMYLQINAVVIDFKSKAFQASLNVSSIWYTAAI